MFLGIELSAVPMLVKASAIPESAFLLISRQCSAKLLRPALNSFCSLVRSRTQHVHPPQPLHWLRLFTYAIRPGTGPCRRVAEVGGGTLRQHRKGYKFKRERREMYSHLASPQNPCLQQTSVLLCHNPERGTSALWESHPSTFPSSRIACHPSPEPECPGSQGASPSASAPK